MVNYPLSENPRIQTIKSILQIYAKIFAKIGYKSTSVRPESGSRQIIYENQAAGKDSTVQLTVVRLAVDKPSITYNFTFLAYPGRKSPVSLQNREIKNINIQLIEAEDYHQLTLQLYFLHPLNYSGEDLIYSVKTEKKANEIRIITGLPWLHPETHMSDEAVWEISGVILSLLENNGL